jgi:hypothetical protein
MAMPRKTYGALGGAALLAAGLAVARAATWVPIEGNVRLANGTPVCAMVLANGQYMFSCDARLGQYDLNVPLDANGRITLFAFADGFAPFSLSLAPTDFPYTAQLRTTATNSPRINMSRAVESSDLYDQVRISGTIQSSDGTPLCAMVLANGQHMFSCDASLGHYDLTVPTDDRGEVTVFGFADGFQPYKDNFSYTDGSQGLFVSTSNISQPSACAENDNINIPIYGNVQSYSIIATHPQYAVGTDNCSSNTTNCSLPGPNYYFVPSIKKLYDDHVTVVEAVTQGSWWQPEGMEASVSGVTATNVTYIRLYRKIADAEEWPQFLALYMDGSLRLIPQPPEGTSQVCFGSSVIVGPAKMADRPIAQLSSVEYLPATDQLSVHYTLGGDAIISIGEVDRTASKVTVSVSYSTDVPFATFRSMYVEDGNADVDSVGWLDLTEAWHHESVMPFPGSDAADLLFYRAVRSTHNTSAPDLRLRDFFD